MKPIEFFSQDVHAFWATTYQLDLKLFDGFLLRRLGGTPLNAVVLCDEDGVSEALLGLTDVDAHVAANANRRYLLRGIRPPSGGRFHPKTYLFVSRRRTTLLVGSGNLTRSGLDRGRETFVSFDAADEANIPTFRAWGAWMRELVNQRGDDALRKRFEHLTASVAALVGPPGPNPFVTNENSPLLDPIEQRAPSQVAELHVCAPYFDERAVALERVIQRFAPDSVHLYLGARTNVDGAALRGVLENADRVVHVNSFEPATFIHAKLIGLVGKDGSGLLVCGSANLSHAALTLTSTSAGTRGNCEAIVMRAGAGESVRAAFVPPGDSVVELPLSSLETLEYKKDDPSVPSWPVRLISAHLASNGHLHIHATGSLEGLGLAWRADRPPASLTASGITADPIEDPDVLIVWLVDAQGNRRSNPVVVDDPRALDAMLGDTDDQRDRPTELRDQDGASELLKLLTWANRRFIFDLEDTPAFQRANAAQDQQQQIDDAGFWDRYAREELVADPRSQTYRPVGTAAPLTDADALLREIEAMLYAAPGDRRLRVITAAGSGPSDHEERQPGAAWTFSARERVRSRNLLRRWARALADPRHIWLSADAPSRNYEALLEVLALIWLSEALEAADIIELLAELWTSFLGSDSRPGVIALAETDLANELVAAVSSDARQIAGALAYCALHGEFGWSTWIYGWQPFLVRGLDLKVIGPGPLASDLVEAMIDVRVTDDELVSAIAARATWTDEVTWGDRLASELNIARVRLVKNAQFRNVTTVVHVDGLAVPTADARLIIVARRAMTFTSSNHVLLICGEQRFLIRLGDYCRALVDARPRTSVTSIDGERLAAVELQGGTLSDLLGHSAAA